MSIAENLVLVRRRIAEKARSVGREPEDITLIAVSKTFPALLVEEAARGGQIHFGENRVQEGEDKIPAVSHDGLTWHLIGHLQSNKVKRAVQLFQWIHSVDSVALLQKLELQAVSIGKKIPILLQLNLASEASKFGMPESELDSTLDAALQLHYMRAEGLMIMP